MQEYDIVIIGGGAAGMAAAISAAESGVRIAVIEAEPRLGGILQQCTHKGFGLSYFGEELNGIEYAERFIKKMTSAAADIYTDTVVLGINEERELTVSGPQIGYGTIRAKAVILASGCREIPIGSLPIAGTRPAGVLAAGAAQKMLNIGHYDIGNSFVILGSGDVGLIVARELALRHKEVMAVIEQSDRCTGLARNRINCLEKFGISLITNATVEKVHGQSRVSGVTMLDAEGNRRFIACDTLITAVGLRPERRLLEVFEGELPPWLFCCGNAEYVHPTVDEVSFEAEAIGRQAAEYVQKGRVMHRQAEAAFCAEAPSEKEGQLCLACPKGCLARRLNGKWVGLACGRTEPQLA